jgi:glycosyltransferase involved in cell wall biosynthesis
MAERVKILHVYKDFDPPIHGGMERHIALMCRYQAQWAHVEALVCARRPFTRIMNRDGTRVTEVGEWGRFQSAPLAPLFPYYLRRLQADVVVVHVPNPTAELSWLMTRPKGTLVVRYHSDVVRQAAAMKIYRPFQRAFLRRADVILPTSQPYLDTSEALQEVRDRCRVVPLGIIPEEFQVVNRERVEALREEYGGDFVLFTGRHRYYKGLNWLVEAAPNINAPVVIAGDGPEREACIEKAEKLGVNITFTGMLSRGELHAHLHACAVFAFPSVERSEAFGISLLEAHACGKPAVATKLGTGVEYANLDGVTGINVPPRDPAALAVAVNELLADRDRAEQMGQAAKARVEKEFRAEKTARLAFEEYMEALECRHSNT